MNIKHAHYMLTVLQEGSITAAAKKLYISQPSLSQMIKLAESNLGTPIFNRSTDPITLTYAGQLYIEAAKQILMINSNLEKTIEEINHEDFGKIRLGIPVQRGMQVLPYVIPHFRKMYPHVAIEVEEQGSSMTEASIREGKVDLAFLTTYPKYEDLHYILIETEEPVLLVGKNTRIAKDIIPGTPIDIYEARNESFISIKKGHSIRTVQDSLFISRGMSPDILFETISIEVAKRTAIAADAVMICPLNYIEMTPGMKNQCFTYPIKGVENKRSFYICHQKDMYLTKYMKDFISIITDKKDPFIYQPGKAPFYV